MWVFRDHFRVSVVNVDASNHYERMPAPLHWISGDVLFKYVVDAIPP